MPSSKLPIIPGVNTTLGRLGLPARLSHLILCHPSSTTSSNCQNHPPYNPKLYTTLIQAIRNRFWFIHNIQFVQISSTLLSKLPFIQGVNTTGGPASVNYHISNSNSTSSSNWHHFHPYYPKIYTHFIQIIPKFKQLSFTTP